MNAVQHGLISPEAALYGHWMEWRTSNRSGRPLSMGNTLRLTGAGSTMSLHSSAPALLHSLKTRCPGDAAPYMNQAQTTYPGRVSKSDAALQLLHPPEEDLEVGGRTVFVESAGEASTPPRTPSRARHSPESQHGAPPSRRRRTQPAAGAARTCSPPPQNWGCPPQGQILQQERPVTPLLLLVVTTRGDPEPVLGITPNHLYGAGPMPRPPLPAPAVRDGVHAFTRTQEVTAVTEVHLVRLPSAPPDDPLGPSALSPAPDWELWRDVWAAWLTHLLPQCRWMTTSPRPRGADATASPPSQFTPPPRGTLHGTAHGTPEMH